MTAKTTSTSLPTETACDLITTDKNDFEDFFVKATEHIRRSRMLGMKLIYLPKGKLKLKI